MSNPITWKNINAPNFNASNVLAMSAAKQLGAAFDSGSQRLIDQGEFNKQRNTDNRLAEVAGFNDIGTFDSQKQQLLGALGNNVDKGAITSALNDRYDFLQTDSTYRREEADRVAVSNAIASIGSGRTVDSPSLSGDNIRDSLLNLNLTPAQQATAMPQLNSLYGATPEEVTAATFQNDMAILGEENRLKIAAETQKQLDITAREAADSSSSGFSAAGGRLRKILVANDRDNGDDNDFLKMETELRKWDANGGRLEVSTGNWKKISEKALATAIQRSATKTRTQWLLGTLGDDPDYDLTPLYEDAMNEDRKILDAKNNFDDPE